ncbi:4-azaleucine resistance probable transporter AzlC [Micromonospora echinaurantiaca]|uniref:4-azaleucine resistance probable transporter AzlC n=1 Tax=Micromonospora echinaurantiaca TaxID=47857 RepID=A0A1C5H4S9_9ACTN|nr:AzlC family ABC transporter permease [Micromonospora echinaurantiaca]SCG41020.1 4-azaleucine resistance probable transporter AzlC [Micromonospora echinaurantiaca]
MRTVQRTADGGVLRDVAAVGAAMVAVGASFGAVAVAAGLPGWATVAMSVLVFAGGAQFMAVGLVAAGNPLAAVLAGLLLNARHLPFGLTLGDSLGARLWQRLLGSHLMTDEATAFALAQPAGPARHRSFWLAAVLFFVTWNVGTVLGVLAGGVAGDPAALGLDAAFPAGLIALLLPSLRDRETRRMALAGAVLAVLTTPLLPAGLPVLLALAGPAVLAVRAVRAGAGTGDREPGATPAPTRDTRRAGRGGSGTGGRETGGTSSPAPVAGSVTGVREVGVTPAPIPDAGRGVGTPDPVRRTGGGSC